jgi:hypothetical protein
MPQETLLRTKPSSLAGAGGDLFVTWRLKGSLPLGVITALRMSQTEGAGRRFREFDLELDKGSFGPDWLKEPRIAAVVAAGLEEMSQRQLWELHAWVAMSIHVRVLFQPKDKFRRIMQLVKGEPPRKRTCCWGGPENIFGGRSRMIVGCEMQVNLGRSKLIL